MGAELKSLEAELVEVRSVLEEAAAVAERFGASRERGAREEWLLRMLGVAALARLRAGDPLGSELLAGLCCNPDKGVRWPSGAGFAS